MHRSLKILIFMSVTLFFNSPNANSNTVYSLYDLCHLANKNAERIKIANDDLYIAQQDKARAMSVLMPRFTAYANHLMYKDDTINSPDTMSKGIKLTQSFTVNGKELIALDVTKQTIKQKQFSLDSIRAQYLLQIAQVYFQILSAKRYHEITIADVKRLEKHKNAVQEKLNVGNVTKTALYRAQAELSKAITEKVKAKNNLNKAKASLKNLVIIDDNYTITTDEAIDITQYSFSLDEITGMALKKRPEIKDAEKLLLIAKKTIKYEESNYWPVFSIEGIYSDTRVKFFDSTVGHHEEDSDNFSIKGELTFTLFDGGLRRGTIRQAMAQARQAKNNLELTKRNIILGAESAYYDYIAFKSALENLDDELKSASENYNAVIMQFQYGMADSVDIMDANTLLVTAERRISDAEYSYALSILNLIYTKGELVSFLIKAP